MKTGFELVLCHPFFELDSKANHRRLPVPNWHCPFLTDIPERQIKSLSKASSFGNPRSTELFDVTAM